MTDRQRLAALNRAVAALKKTEKAYDPSAPNWSRALHEINTVRADLARPPVPNLGPVLVGGLSIMLMAPTHMTDGVGFPAFDTAFGQAGRAVIAPEALTVTDQSGSQGGDAFYARGASGIVYWIGHLVSSPATGTRFRKGDTIGRVAAILPSQGGPHSHWGLDVRPLIGHHLAWGANGNGPPYTYGSPTIGAQLAKGMQ